MSSAFEAGHRVLITGGHGVIGRRVVARLLENEDITVRVLDTESRTDIDARCVQIAGSILDRTTVQNSVSNCDTVVHLAGMTAVSRCADDPLDCFETNVVGTASVLAASRRAKVAHIVLASTAHVYGYNNAAAISETDAVHPASIYAASKAAAELAAEALADSDMRITILRLANVYGPGCNLDTVIGKMITAVRQGLPASIRDGAPIRDFVFIDDVADAFVRIVRSGPSSDPVDILNVATGEGHSIKDVAACVNTVAREFGRAPAIAVGEPATQDRSTLVLAIDALTRRLGWHPTTALAEGLRRTLQEELLRVR